MSDTTPAPAPDEATPALDTSSLAPDLIPDDEIVTVEQVTEGEFIDGDHTDSQI